TQPACATSAAASVRAPPPLRAPGATVAPTTARPPPSSPSAATTCGTGTATTPNVSGTDQYRPLDRRSRNTRRRPFGSMRAAGVASIALALLAALLFAASATLQHHAARSTLLKSGDAGPRPAGWLPILGVVRRLVRNRIWILGVLVNAAG